MRTNARLSAAGSTLAATDANGQVVGGNQPRYDAYGQERTPSVAGLPTDYRYTGQRQDGTGLYDYGARMYDPALGVFLSPDPILLDPGDVSQLNPYAYTGNNPLRYVDPTGHARSAPDGGMPTGAPSGGLIDALVRAPGQLVRWAAGGLAGEVSALLRRVGIKVGVDAAPAAQAMEQIACGDHDCANEARAITQILIADTDVVMGKLVQPGQAAVTSQTIEELIKLGRLGTAQGFATISVDAQPGFAQAQGFFNQLLPNLQGKAGDVYNLATAAMSGGKYITADKATIFNPLVSALKSGLVTGYTTGNQVMIEVPGIGQVLVELVQHK